MTTMVRNHGLCEALASLQDLRRCRTTSFCGTSSLYQLFNTSLLTNSGYKSITNLLYKGS
jgi:hypothetical protein